MTGSLEQLVDGAEADLDRMVADVVTEIVANIPVYADGGVVTRDDLRRSVRHQLVQMTAALRDPQVARDLTAPRETGRRRAVQGAPLPEVIRAFRLCFEGFWRRLAEEIRRSPDPETIDTVLDAAGKLWRLADDFTVELTDSYRGAASELLLARQRRRSALAQALFSGEPGPPTSAWEVPALLGFPADTDLVVVSAEAAAPGQEPLPGIELRLGRRGIVSVWQLTPARQNGIVALGAGRLEDVVSELQEVARARTGVSPRYRPLSETPRALHLAGVAAVSTRTGDSLVTVFDASPLAGLLAQDSEESARMARAVLGPVLDLPASERDVLLRTARAWFDAEGSPERAAAELYCHANTVRNRLHRIRELTGRRFGNPWEVAELVAALQATTMARDGARSGTDEFGPPARS